jgi:hypothetical protein
MPRQETFLTVKDGDESVEVLKTYDETYAREAFSTMDDAALAHLAASLKPESIYEEGGIPKPGDDGYEDFIWDVMVDDAREDWKTFSYFVVCVRGLAHGGGLRQNDGAVRNCNTSEPRLVFSSPDISWVICR